MDTHEDKMQQENVELEKVESDVCEEVEEEFIVISRRKKAWAETPRKDKIKQRKIKQSDNLNTNNARQNKRQTNNRNSFRTKTRMCKYYNENNENCAKSLLSSEFLYQRAQKTQNK